MNNCDNSKLLRDGYWWDDGHWWTVGDKVGQDRVTLDKVKTDKLLAVVQAPIADCIHLELLHSSS